MAFKFKVTALQRVTSLRWAAMAQAVVLMLAGMQAGAQEGNRLQDIQVNSLPGQRVELKLITSGNAPEPLAFTIENPARIALDLPDTALGLSSRRRDVNLGPLDTVLTAEANGRTRVVLNLDTMVAYETNVAGNTVTVTLGAGGDYSPGNTQFASAAPSSGSSRPSYSSSSAGRAITNVDFRRTRDGGGRVIVNLTDPGTPVDIRQEGGRVVAVFKDTSLPPELMRRLDVNDFATPVTTVDTLRTNLDTRIVISADGEYDQLAYQSDNEFTIEVNPVVQTVQEGASLYTGTREYDGQRLTLNFQDIETRAVLQLLAETSGRNIVVSDTVQGNVTLRLRNVPWDQALDIVMTTKGLDMRENGNVIIVAPAEEIAARETAELEAQMAISELEPLYSEFLQVNYAKAGDLANLIRGEGTGSMLSERGTVATDERTNTLLVQDTAERLQDIRRMVTALDIPIKQVLIESRIVVVNDDFSRDLGIRLGVTAIDQEGENLWLSTGTGDGTDTMLGSALENLADPTNGTPFPIEVPTIGNRYNVNVPIDNPAGRFSLAVLNPDYLVDLELTALEAEGRGEIVSTPRVITANQKEARIEQGVEIPYQEAASSGATTIQFKKAVLSLTVTPQITPDNNIIMDLAVNKDSVGEIISTGGLGGTVPSIDTRQVQTQVLVADGQTVVLGGIYETERRETISKVPFLGDIPVIGYAFKSRTRVDNKAELLIFVTPRIVVEGGSIY